ncbi:hypothetical protein EUTSA_v10028271mg [Eutrema salsugineum]|uniref:KANL3/Tex30 alpha/beta hydrolase-like domain-containing protein n=1 Tax=Eutrema salsugineum TaxID=72664 RepID=V4NK72_EUTSA|nr:hypothetical protein EUTSA_v10028271mg [Eutrema salsugineum]
MEAKKRRRRNEESEKPCSPVVVFAHGAGAPSSSGWMIRWKEMIKKTLDKLSHLITLVNIAGGKRKVPPKAEKLVSFHVDVVKETAARFPGHPLILAGKSMGSRVSCMVAVSEDVTVSAVICLGYPLKGMNGAIRDETLLEMGVPVIFVQGSKDPLCPLDKLQAVCSNMKTVTELHVIDGGDHSLEITKKHLETKGLTQDQVEDVALQAIAAFVSKSHLLAC